MDASEARKKFWTYCTTCWQTYALDFLFFIDELSPSYVFKSNTGHWTQMIWAETDRVSK